MKNKIQALVNLSLKLHKALLDLERVRFEEKNGPILDNNAYFNLVLSHEDFKWLRVLLEVIALIDEEAEAENINTEKISGLIINLKELLSANNITEFSQHYQAAVSSNENIGSLDNQLEIAIKDLSF